LAKTVSPKLVDNLAQSAHFLVLHLQHLQLLRLLRQQLLK
jgi:hypothetical protein